MVEFSVELRRVRDGGIECGDGAGARGNEEARESRARVQPRVFRLAPSRCTLDNPDSGLLPYA